MRSESSGQLKRHLRIPACAMVTYLGLSCRGSRSQTASLGVRSELIGCQ